MNFKEMASDLGFDENDFTELAQLLVTTSLSDLKKLENGVGLKNADKVAKAAHSIKGAAGNLGFIKISTVAAEIESDARRGSLVGIEKKIKTIKAGLDLIITAIDK